MMNTACVQVFVRVRVRVRVRVCVRVCVCVLYLSGGQSQTGAGHGSGFSRLSCRSEHHRGEESEIMIRRRMQRILSSSWVAPGDHIHPCRTQLQLVSMETT